MFEYDPVCGKRMNPTKAYATVEEHGELFYLCSRLCQLMFESDPDEYLRSTEWDCEVPAVVPRARRPPARRTTTLKEEGRHHV